MQLKHAVFPSERRKRSLPISSLIPAQLDPPELFDADDSVPDILYTRSSSGFINLKKNDKNY